MNIQSSANYKKKMNEEEIHTPGASAEKTNQKTDSRHEQLMVMEHFLNSGITPGSGAQSVHMKSKSGSCTEGWEEMKTLENRAESLLDKVHLVFTNPLQLCKAHWESGEDAGFSFIFTTVPKGHANTFEDQEGLIQPLNLSSSYRSCLGPHSHHLEALCSLLPYGTFFPSFPPPPSSGLLSSSTGKCWLKHL